MLCNSCLLAELLIFSSYFFLGYVNGIVYALDFVDYQLALLLKASESI